MATLPQVIRGLQRQNRRGSIEAVGLTLLLTGGLVIIGKMTGLPAPVSFVIVMAGLFGVLSLKIRW